MGPVVLANSLYKSPGNYFNAKLLILNESYINGDPVDSKLNKSQLYLTDIAGSYQSNQWAVFSDFQAGHYTEFNNSYLAVRELNMRFLGVENLSLILGRKYENWSSISKKWGLSLWEPDFALDPLRTVHQGLTGFFFVYQKDSSYLSVFASSVFVPNLGPQVMPNKDGRIEVKSRWAERPDSHFPFNGKSTQIFYSLDLPEIAKIVTQKSLALFGQVGNRDQGVWTSFAIARKPVNDLVLSYQGVLRLRDNGSFGDVKIAPVVIEHDIASMDIGYQWAKQSMILSHTSESPKNFKPQEGWNAQQFEAIRASAIQWNWDIYEYFNQTLKIGLGRFFLNGGEIAEIDAYGNPSHAMDGTRVRFKDAWSFDLQSPLYGNPHWFLSGEIHFIRDLAQAGSLLNSEISLRAGSQMSVKLGADIIGVRDNSENNKNKGFLNINRANDRVYAGVTYVF
jgi:hypothetical protein